MKKANEIYYGGDYNPEQWDEATLDQDMKLFKKVAIAGEMAKRYANYPALASW